MKLVHCNGRLLEIYEIAKPVLTIQPCNTTPIKFNGWRICDDDEARDIASSMLKARHPDTDEPLFEKVKSNEGN